MLDTRHPLAAVFVILIAATPCLGLDDGITLSVDRGVAPGEVVLEWSGGTSPYRVYRSDTPSSVTVTENLLGETSMSTWTDTAPPGDVSFYRVTSVPTVFRMTDIDLRDPHVFVSVIILCLDVTESDFNPQLQAAITTDADLDGLLDLSVLALFRPLDQGSAGGDVELGLGDCTVPPDTVCDQDPANPPVPTTFSNVTMGSCMTPYAGTTSGYLPPIVSPGAPPTCPVTDAVSVELTLGATTLPLQDTQVAANYLGDPADSLVNGLMRGFISETDADAAMVDIGTGLVPLSSLLPGGTGNCAAGDDRDLGLDGSTLGWWMYFNLIAEETAYIGP